MLSVLSDAGTDTLRVRLRQQQVLDLLALRVLVLNLLALLLAKVTKYKC